MKQESIAVILFLLALQVTGLVGPIPLSLAIVATYGLALRLVRRRKPDQKITTALGLLSVAIMGPPMLGLLVFLWSISVDLSFSWSVITWAAILGLGTACTAVARPVLPVVTVDCWKQPEYLLIQQG